MLQDSKVTSADAVDCVVIVLHESAPGSSIIHEHVRLRKTESDTGMRKVVSKPVSRWLKKQAIVCIDVAEQPFMEWSSLGMKPWPVKRDVWLYLVKGGQLWRRNCPF